MSQRKPLYWVDPLMRFGYTARGVVYVLVGAFALIAAKDHTPAPDSKTALGELLDQPFGEVLLGVIALGLAAYAGWRFVCAILDLENKGGELKGWSARIAQIISAVLHLSLGMSAAALIWRTGGSGGDRTESWTAKILSEPFGRWMIAIVGAIAIGMGIQHFIKAHKEKYRENLRYTPLAARLAPVIKFGIVAHGVVVLIMGIFFMWAAWSTDASRAGGLGDALNALRNIGIGQIGLATVAAGLLAFSAYCFIEAIYRVVPRCAPEGLTTLASKAQELAAGAQRAIADTARAVRP
jgi:X-X-X-Leu-X-X-Gly heptad repeat protein